MDPVDLINVLSERSEEIIPIKCSNDKCIADFAATNKGKQIKDVIDTILEEHNVDLDLTNVFLKELSVFMVPVGRIASTRGYMFNKLVESIIKKELGKHSHIDILIEFKHPLLHERLDWMIKNTKTKKVLLGFNQIDLWSGGHQVNRGSKYILDENIHKTLSKRRIKLVNVVLDAPKRLTKGSKVYDIVNKGVTRNRLVNLTLLKALLAEFAREA